MNSFRISAPAIATLAFAPFALFACSPAAADLPPPPVVANADMAGQALFVTNKGEDTLSKVDLATGAEVKRVDSCTTPHELSVSPDGQYVAVGCYGGSSLSIFNTADLSAVKSIELGDGARPHGLVWHANGDLYATAEGRKSMFWVEDPMANEPGVFEYATGKDGSHMLAVAENGNQAWTVDMQSGTVTRVDLKTRRAPLSVAMGSEPEGIALTPDGSALWVSARGSNEAFELDPATLEVRQRLDTGRFPLRLAIRPQGDVAITSDLQDGGLSVIDLESGELSRSIAIGGPDQAEQRFQVTIIWSADGERIYAAETGTNTVAEVDYASGEVLRRFSVGEDGDGLAILAPASTETEDDGE
ncbi:YncE family protein [Parerythrobacter jejuensis]|uniref:Beta-propeller fold lactonase family protein n=1 Tax=Parerythrobacter jejuensis TaxID=795812 RepID=A0A845ATW7_9SPHN|nr:YncE family protein [Parerythrobacter jejuensis]MXP32603.1 beta-propeller fold lactonase family protein [Parerythrobacter jejuensis]